MLLYGILLLTLVANLPLLSLLIQAVNENLQKDVTTGVNDTGVAMSNQRSFKIGSFLFAAFVPKKIECKRF
jgi:hypothetical protein